MQLVLTGFYHTHCKNRITKGVCDYFLLPIMASSLSQTIKVKINLYPSANFKIMETNFFSTDTYALGVIGNIVLNIQPISPDK